MIVDSVVQRRLNAIFFGDVISRVDVLKSEGRRFVHYSSAAAAYSIIENQEFWMRRAGCMNDSTEIQYGYECLKSCIDGSLGDKLRKILDSAFPDLASFVLQEFERQINELRSDTWLTCLSEHNDHEDEHGRLSMWRAYGGTRGVAIVMKNDIFFTESDALGVSGQPVFYLTRTDFSDKFARMVARIEAEADFLANLEYNEVGNLLISFYLNALYFTKHPGFAEEREWRIFHNPHFQDSSRLIRSTEVVHGIPQTLYKIPLKNIPEKKFFGLEVRELIDRIIIGPCDQALAAQDAFINQIERFGVTDAASKVVISGIPLRQ